MNVVRELFKIANLLVAGRDGWRSVKNNPSREYKVLPDGEKEYRDTQRIKVKKPSEEEKKEKLKREIKKKLK